MLVGQEHGAHARVARLPGLAAVVRSIEAGGGDRDPHPVGVRRIEHDGVQTQPAAPRHPSRPVLVVEQSLHRRPRHPGVVGAEERRRLDAAPDDVRLLRAPGHDLPHLRERQPRRLREAHRLPFGSAPAPPEVVARADRRPPVVAVHAGQEPRAAAALIEGERVHGLAGEVRAVHPPPRARRVGGEDEGALGGSDEDEDVAQDVAGGGDAARRHGGEMKAGRGSQRALGRCAAQADRAGCFRCFFGLLLALGALAGTPAGRTRWRRLGSESTTSRRTRSWPTASRCSISAFRRGGS